MLLRFGALIMASSLFAGCGGNDERAAAPPIGIEPQPTLIAYAAEENSIAEVFDLSKNTLLIQSKADVLAGKPIAESEFAGPLSPCAADGIYCFLSGLIVAVPADGVLSSSWSVDGITCSTLEAAPASEAGTKVAECRFEAGATRFEYSADRGIVRFHRECSTCDTGSFRLVSKRGLFAKS